MRVAIDIDGVLANFTKGFSHIVNTVEPGRIPDGYTPPDWGWTDKLDPATTDKAWQLLKKVDNFWLSLQPHRENVDALGEFIDESKADIYYVTSRVASGGSGILGQTNSWLTRQGLNRDNCSVIVMPPGGVKGQVYNALGIQYSIDDYHENVYGALLHDPKRLHTPFLLNRSWNASNSELNAFRMPDLKSFLDYVRRKIERN